MAVLVTGGAGYIGSHMAMALADAGEEVIVLDDLSVGLRGAVDRRARLVVGDTGDSALILRIIAKYGVEDIVHFAAKIVVPDSVADPLGYYLTNTANSRALIAAAVNARVKRFVFSSSAAVYGMPEKSPVAEDAPLLPISPYGSSKLITEWMLRDAAAAHGIGYAALRYFNVAGADPAGRAGQSAARATHLIKIASEFALGKRERMDVYGTDYPTPDGTCIRDYVHVTDLVAAHLDALRHLRDGGGNLVLNCGYGHGYSVLEVLDAVRKASGVELPVVMSPRRPGDPPTLVARADRISSELNWRPRYDDLATIVEHALTWERKLPAKPLAAA